MSENKLPTEIEKCKGIVAFEFKTELAKLRDNKYANEIGNAFTAIEIEIHKKFVRLEQGEEIKSIVPDFKYHSELQ